MSSIQFHKLLGVLGATAMIASVPSLAAAQGIQGAKAEAGGHTRSDDGDVGGSPSDAESAASTYAFKSRADSIAWARHRDIAEHAKGFHLIVSLQDKHLWAVIGDDTVLSAPAAVASGTTLQFGKREWTFDMPRGVRTVLGKEADPIWQPPEWLYAETAKEYGLKLGHLYNGQKIKLSDGRYLSIEHDVAGVIDDGQFEELPTDEHIVFDSTLFVPPLGSKNRKVEGELGKYRLILGDGFLLHGTPDKESIGLAATHGCVRLRDEDIEWLYDHVPVGTKVYIY